MTRLHDEVSEGQKEACAVSAMRAMLEDYAKAHDVPFEDAFYRFVGSRAYDLLFDYSLEYWREGPEFLMAAFERFMDDEPR
ncbi:hypothetical protein [Arabiibacter massiliensis]|uniref:hypothetical protein n=1 Tax=Arabiibacter massiliensis TaxID=1870985 RepID=UPI0009B9773F|nr:hypothetical protein [Arabiibacter massiliensis]